MKPWIFLLIGALLMACNPDPICFTIDTPFGFQAAFGEIGDEEWCASEETLFGEDRSDPLDGRWYSLLAVNREWELVPLCSPYGGRIEFRAPDGAERTSSFLRTGTGKYIDMSGGKFLRARISPPLGGNSGSTDENGDGWLSLTQLNAAGSPVAAPVRVSFYRDIGSGSELELLVWGISVGSITPYDPEGDEAWIRLRFEDADGGTPAHVYLDTAPPCGDWTERLDGAIGDSPISPFDPVDLTQLGIDILMNVTNNVEEPIEPGWIGEICTGLTTPEE